MLKSRDGTVLTWKRGFQMSECLFRRLPGLRQIWRRATLGESAAYVALAVNKALPNSIGRRDAKIQVQGAKGMSLVVTQSKHEVKKFPQDACAKAQAFDSIGGAYAEGVSAAVMVFFAIVAEDPSAAPRFPAILILRVAPQSTVENQSTGHFAVRTRRKFQALIQAQKIFLRTVKPCERKAQRNPPKTKNGDYTALQNFALPRPRDEAR